MGVWRYLLFFFSLSTLAAETPTIFSEARRVLDDVQKLSESDPKKYDEIFKIQNKAVLSLLLRTQFKNTKALVLEASQRLSSSDPQTVQNAFKIINEEFDQREHGSLKWAQLKFPPNTPQNLIKYLDSNLNLKEKKTLFRILLSPNTEGKSSRIDMVLDQAQKNPKEFIEVLSTKNHFLYVMTEDQSKKAQALYEQLDPKEKKLYEHIFLVRESAQFNEWARKSLLSSDAKSVQGLLNISLEYLADHFTPEREQLLYDLFKNKSPHLHDAKEFIFDGISYLKPEQKGKFKPLIKRLLLEKKSGEDPSEILEGLFSDLLNHEDLDYLDLLFKIPHKKDSVLNTLKGIDSEKVELINLITNRFSAPISQAIFSEIETKDIAPDKLQSLAQIQLKMGEMPFDQWTKKIQNAWTELSKLKDLPSYDFMEVLVPIKGPKAHFLQLWKKSKELSPEQNNALLLFFVAHPHLNFSGVSATERQAIDAWALEALKGLSAQDLKQILKVFSGYGFYNLTPFYNWIAECSKGNDDKASYCKVYQDKRNALENSGHWATQFAEKTKGKPYYYFGAYGDELPTIEEALKTYTNPPSDNPFPKALAALILWNHASALREAGLLSQSNKDLKNDYKILLNHPNLSIRSHAISAYEEFDTPSFELSLNNKTYDLCATFCSGAETLLDTLVRKPDPQSPWNERPSYFARAVTLLKMTTVYRASLVCKKNKKLLNFKKQLLDVIEKKNINETSDPLKHFISEQFQKTLYFDYNSSTNTSVFYALVYMQQLLLDVSQKNDSKNLKNLTAQIQKIALPMLLDPKLKSDSGSGTNLYAYSSMLHSLNFPPSPSGDHLKVLNEVASIVRQSLSPLALPYNPTRPEYSMKENVQNPERAGIARALVLHTALYRNDPRAKEKKNHKKNLLDALEKYFVNYFQDLAAHLQRDGTHRGPDHIAPYYLYPSLYYSRYAFEALEKDSTLSDKERQRLKFIKHEAMKKITSLLKEDGTFKLSGDDEIQSQTLYKGFYDSDQSHALMALSSFAACEDHPKKTQALPKVSPQQH